MQITHGSFDHITASVARANRFLRLFDGCDLRLGRVHEFCGPARRRLALWAAAQLTGPVLWIRPAWHPDHLHMQAVAEEIDPARLIFAAAERREDLLWVMEEALRSGACPMVIADLLDPPNLTAVRRLHLAAEASGKLPFAALLTPHHGGASGVETRFSLTARHGCLGAFEGDKRQNFDLPAGLEARLWQMQRLRARLAPPAAWEVRHRSNGLLAQPIAPSFV
ncbi:hypothetical protein OE810_02650 [Rhodobacteraceae bacterium XHP0102]|nr:hypothetical protein [Rhodobacteraceae bacterium XHP0102]